MKFISVLSSRLLYVLIIFCLSYVLLGRPLEVDQLRVFTSNSGLVSPHAAEVSDFFTGKADTVSMAYDREAAEHETGDGADNRQKRGKIFPPKILKLDPKGKLTYDQAWEKWRMSKYGQQWLRDHPGESFHPDDPLHPSNMLSNALETMSGISINSDVFPPYTPSSSSSSTSYSPDPLDTSSEAWIKWRNSYEGRDYARRHPENPYHPNDPMNPEKNDKIPIINPYFSSLIASLKYDHMDSPDQSNKEGNPTDDNPTNAPEDQIYSDLLNFQLPKSITLVVDGTHEYHPEHTLNAIDRLMKIIEEFKREYQLGPMNEISINLAIIGLLDQTEAHLSSENQRLSEFINDQVGLKSREAEADRKVKVLLKLFEAVKNDANKAAEILNRLITAKVEHSKLKYELSKNREIVGFTESYISAVLAERERLRTISRGIRSIYGLIDRQNKMIEFFTRTRLAHGKKAIIQLNQLYIKHMKAWINTFEVRTRLEIFRGHISNKIAILAALRTERADAVLRRDRLLEAGKEETSYEVTRLNNRIATLDERIKDARKDRSKSSAIYMAFRQLIETDGFEKNRLAVQEEIDAVLQNYKAAINESLNQFLLAENEDIVNQLDEIAMSLTVAPFDGNFMHWQFQQLRAHSEIRINNIINKIISLNNAIRRTLSYGRIGSRDTQVNNYNAGFIEYAKTVRVGYAGTFHELLAEKIAVASLPTAIANTNVRVKEGAYEETLEEKTEKQAEDATITLSDGVYPNPTSGEVHVAISLEQASILSFVLHNIEGVKIFEMNHAASKGFQVINLGDLKSKLGIRPNQLCLLRAYSQQGQKMLDVKVWFE